MITRSGQANTPRAAFPAIGYMWRDRTKPHGQLTALTGARDTLLNRLRR